ncbi:MAG: hypothetical protein V1646_01175 [bacterium]
MINLFGRFRLTRFRLNAILVTIIYISALLFIQHKRFLADDQAPKLQQVDEKTQKLASIVHVGMYVNSFPIFSFDSGDFTIDAMIWFKFPAATEALATIEQFTLYNGFIQQNGKLLYRSAPIIKLVGEDVVACYHIQTSFKLDMNYKFFPIGDHTLHILLENKSATAQELCFVSDEDSFSLSKNTLIKNWFAKKKTVKSGYIKANLDPKNSALEISYPAVIFSVDFENTGMKKIGSLYLPMFILFLIGLLSLLLAIGDSLRLQLIVSALPSLGLFRLVIDGASPNTGYAMHVDIVFYTFMLLLLIILGFQLYETLTLNNIKHMEEEAQERIKTWLEKMSDIIFVSTLVLLMALLTYSFYK